MNTSSKSWLRLASAAMAAAALAFGPAAAHADDGFPNRPIRLVVGFGPGTSVDIVARIVAAKVQSLAKQAVIVENKPGAGSLIALKEVARANPDGYTLIIAAMPNISIAPSLNADLGLDPERDLMPVVGIADSDLVLVVSEKRNPATTLQEFVDWGRKQKSVFYGTLGAGTLGHFGGVLFSDTTGIKIDLVHYKAASDSYIGLVNGDVQATLLASSVAASQLRSGSVRVLASTGAARSPSFPDVPTFKESNFPDMQFGAWYGIFAPAKTPAGILEKINAEFVAATRDQEVRSKMEAAGFSVTGTTRADFARAVHDDTVRWAKVAKSAGLSAN